MAKRRRRKFNSRVLKASVLGANDGIITTFAIVAGSVGAGLPVKVILILGVTNMIADAVSMASGDFLGERSEWQLQHERDGKKIPARLWKTSLATFLSFVLAGTLPLSPYFLAGFGLIDLELSQQFTYSILATGLALFLVGSMRSFLLRSAWWRNGLEMLGVGSVAALIAFSLGAIVERLVSHFGLV